MRFLFLTIYLFTTEFGFGHACAKEITIEPNWKVGDRRVYEIKTTELLDDDEDVGIAKRKFPLTIEVIRADDKAIHLRCTYGEIELENEERTLYIDHQVGKSFVLQCQPDGSNIRIENVDEIKNSYPKLVQALYEGRQKAGQKEELNKYVFEIQSSEKAQAEFINSFVADALFVFLPYGKTLDTAKPLQLKGELPNRFNVKKPFPSDIEWKLSDSSTTQNSLVIQWNHALNAKKAVPLIEEAIKEFEAKYKQKYPEETLKKFRSTSDTNSAIFQYDPQTTWMISVRKQSTKSDLAPEYKRTWEYRLVTP